MIRTNDEILLETLRKLTKARLNIKQCTLIIKMLRDKSKHYNISVFTDAEKFADKVFVEKCLTEESLVLSEVNVLIGKELIVGEEEHNFIKPELEPDKVKTSQINPNRSYAVEKIKTHVTFDYPLQQSTSYSLIIYIPDNKIKRKYNSTKRQTSK